MKTEKIERRMRKRTVVYARDRYDVIIGVITRLDGDNLPLGVEGLATDTEHDVDSFSWFTTSDVRKATDDERAAFFAWLVSDGNDLADGFARFGGAPRGFEEWRAAQDAPAEATPEPASKHKRGDVRVWLRSNGIGAVARVKEAGFGWLRFEEYNPLQDDVVYEPTRENVAMLVAKQRERGIEPEVGDLVYVMGRWTGGISGRIALVMGGAGAEMLLARAGDRAPIGVGTDPMILVIRRNPLREVGDA